MPSKPQQIPFEPGSGNIFADLGFENAEELQTKAHLICRIGSALRPAGAGTPIILSIDKAVTLLGLSAEEIDWIVRGRFNEASEIAIERLEAALATLEKLPRDEFAATLLSLEGSIPQDLDLEP